METSERAFAQFNGENVSNPLRRWDVPMHAKMVSLITCPGKRQELCLVIEKDISPLVQKQSGFVDHMTLISEPEPRLVTVISLWKTKSDAKNYHDIVFPTVRQYLKPFLAIEPVVTAFLCFSVNENAQSIEKANVVAFPSRRQNEQA